MSSIIEKRIAPKHYSVTKSVFWVSFANIVSKFLTFISSIVTARFLYPSDFGIIAVAATFSGLVEYCAKLGVSQFLISRESLSDEDIHTIYNISLLIGLFLGLIMAFGSPLAAKFYKTPEVVNILVFSGISFFLNNMAGVPRALMAKAMRQNTLAMVDIINNFANVALIIIMAVLGFKYMSFVVPLAVTSLFYCIAIHKLSRWHFSPTIHREILKPFFKYSGSFVATAFLGYIIYNANYIFTGYFLGATLLGYFYFGFEKALIAVLIYSNVAYGVFFPMISKVQSDNRELKSLFIGLIEKQTFILYPFIFIQMFMAKEFMQFLYGARWDNSIFTFQMILGYAFTRGTGILLQILFNATGRPHDNLKHLIIFTPICVTSMFLGVKFGGLFGVALASFLVQSFGVILLLSRASRVFDWKLSELIQKNAMCFIPILLQLPILFPVKYFMDANNYSNFIKLLVICPLIIILYLLFSKIFINEIYLKTFVVYKEKVVNKFTKIS